MAIPQSTLLRYAGQRPIAFSAQRVIDAKIANKQTAFLSHSHKDAELAKGVQAFLQAQNWEVYIDWEDATMPDSPDRETAARIQAKIRELNWFLFLATENSVGSRWCPWEIGYADGVKLYENILILPTTNEKGNHGNEYMQLYRHIDSAQGGGYSAFRPDKTGIKLALLQPK